ncbi:MAG: hypothetical protein ACE15C_19130 [Phycisphaerae bacterium]
MKFSVSHDWSEETPEAKAQWFQSLTVEKRMAIFTEITEMALAINPDVTKKKSVTYRELAEGKVRILRAEDARPK